MRKTYALTKEGVKQAPQTIGVYQFLRGREVLYIGKAVNIKARLVSHLQNAHLDPKEEAMVENADRIRVIPTESEFKALLLEAQLIKREKPKFNKIWRDDKSYLYIRVTSEEYPKVLLARAKETPKMSGDLFFGPFPSARITQELIREIRRVVPFCTRKKIGRGACFHSKIGLCGPCPSLISSLKSKGEKQKLGRQYRKNIRQAIKILKGQTEPVRKELETQIKKLSKEERFEEALILRNRMLRFERLITQTLGITPEAPPYSQQEEPLKKLKKALRSFFPQLNSLGRIEAYDVSNLTGREATASMVVLTEGAVDKSQYRKFKIKSLKIRGGDTQMMEEVVRRRFAHPWPKPDLIVADGGKPQVRIITEVVREMGENIPVIGLAKTPDRIVVGTEKFPTVHLPITHPGFNLLRLIRDESHRFSRKYHLFLRTQRLLP